MNLIEIGLRAEVLKYRFNKFAEEVIEEGFSVKFDIDQNVGIIVGIFDLFTNNGINHIFPFQQSLYSNAVGDYEIEVCEQLCEKLKAERRDLND